MIALLWHGSPGQGRARQGVAVTAQCVCAGPCGAGLGSARQSRCGRSRHCVARRDRARLGSRGKSRQDVTLHGTVGHRGARRSGQRKACQRKAKRGSAWQGRVRLGDLGPSRPGMAGSG